MDTTILIFLGVGVGIILLSILLGRLVKPGQDRHDANGSRRDGDASATWIGIREAGRDIDPKDH